MRPTIEFHGHLVATKCWVRSSSHSWSCYNAQNNCPTEDLEEEKTHTNISYCYWLFSG